MEETNATLGAKVELKDDATILISEKGEGSKHNIAGWKGLAWKDDKVEILDHKIVKIGDARYVKAKVIHNLNKYKNPKQPEYRTYTGYIETSSFKREEQEDLVGSGSEAREAPLAGETLSIDEDFQPMKTPAVKGGEAPGEVKMPKADLPKSADIEAAKVLQDALNQKALEMGRALQTLFEELIAKRFPGQATLIVSIVGNEVIVKNEQGLKFAVEINAKEETYVLEGRSYKNPEELEKLLLAYMKTNSHKLARVEKEAK